MSSLLQSSGRFNRKGQHELFLTLVKPNPDPNPFYETIYAEQVPCPEHFESGYAHEQHPVIWRIWRKPVDMFGQYVVFRYNGEEHIPDLSLPIEVDRLPRDAKRLTDEEILSYWHSS